jgi:hypothetical protein
MWLKVEFVLVLVMAIIKLAITGYSTNSDENSSVGSGLLKSVFT